MDLLISLQDENSTASHNDVSNSGEYEFEYVTIIAKPAHMSHFAQCDSLLELVSPGKVTRP